MGIKKFFKPDNFRNDVLRGRVEGETTIELGRQAIKDRSKRWYTFFMWLPAIAYLFFYIEGKREEKRRIKSGMKTGKMSFKTFKKKRGRKYRK